jgi:glycolate oxidase FAD binding subunit
MSSLADRLGELEAIVGPANLLTATEAVSEYRVDGRQPLAVALPASADQLGAVLRAASRTGLSVLLRGAGRHLHLGAVPGPIGLIVSVARLNEIVDFDHENLTITAQAGTTLAAVQQVAAGRRQMLPLDPPGGDGATIGGLAAANLAGPLRARYGAPRDLIIGVRAALSDGTLIKAGGKTVKNVAGYELTKLLVGSLGTLAAITEVTARLAPMPEVTAVLAAALPFDRLRAIARELVASPLEIASLTACDPLSLRRAGLAAMLRASPGSWWLLAGLVGDSLAVERQERDVRGLIAGDCLRLDGEDATRAWRGIREAAYPSVEGEAIARLSVPLSETLPLMEAIARWQGWWALARIEQGLIQAGAPPGKGLEETMRKLGELRPIAESRGGFLVLEAAPPELKRGFSVWGEGRNEDLMRRLKESYDRAGTLGCGRLLAGL